MMIAQDGSTPPPRPAPDRDRRRTPALAGARSVSWVTVAVVAVMVVRPSLDIALTAFTMSLGPVQVSPGFLLNLLLLGLAAYVAIDAMLSDGRLQGALIAQTVIWLPFLVAAAIAATHTPVPGDAIKALANFATYAAISLLAFAVAPQLGEGRLTIVVLASGVVPVLWALAQVAVHGAGYRAEGTFTHPNILAFFLQVYIAFLFHAQLSGYVRDARVRIAIWLMIALALVVVLLTGTRSAFVGLYVFLIAYSLVRRPAMLIPLLLLPPLALLVPGVVERIVDVTGARPSFTYDYVVSVARGDIADSPFIQIDSGTWRMYLWYRAWPWVEQSPLTGWGLASFRTYSLQFFGDLSTGQGSEAHNSFLQMLFEGGALLLAGFIWTYLGTALQHLANARFGRGEAVFAILLVLSYGFALSTDNVLYYLSANLQFFFLLSGLAAIGASRKASLAPRERRAHAHALAARRALYHRRETL